MSQAATQADQGQRDVVQARPDIDVAASERVGRWIDQNERDRTDMRRATAGNHESSSGAAVFAESGTRGPPALYLPPILKGTSKVPKEEGGEQTGVGFGLIQLKMIMGYW